VRVEGSSPAPVPPTPAPRLDGKVALVAGASRGIGSHIAASLASAGAAVAVAARSETEGRLAGTIHSVAREIERGGGMALPVRMDVTDEDSVAAAVSRASAELGPIDVLVANAGYMWLSPTSETPLRRWELCLKVNLTGVFLVTRAVLPSVLEQGAGSLVAVTTTGVKMTNLGANAYWVSKAGVERYYMGLASELADRNIAVNCLAPSRVVLTEGARAQGISVPPEMTEPPGAVAQAAVHLAAQDASGITGGVHYSLDLLESLSSGRVPSKEGS
jgi:citronellol/citronellal dehydrogenase